MKRRRVRWPKHPRGMTDEEVMERLFPSTVRRRMRQTAQEAVKKK